MSFYLLRPCRGKAAFEAIPKFSVVIDLDRGDRELKAHGYDVTHAGVMLVCSRGGTGISVYPSGKLLIRNASREKAIATANAVYELLDIGGEI